MWKGDTSSDEVISYYFALPLYADLVCETQEEKNEAISLIIRTIDYVLVNNYKLIGYGGVPTSWGFWDPATLNGDPDHATERCENSMEIIAMLSVAYHYTKN